MSCVLIVHESPLFRVGLRSVLGRHKEIQIVGEVGEVIELGQLLELTVATRPDVVLFDGAFTSCQPAYSAVEVVDQMRRVGARGILVFAPSLDDEESLFRFLVNGAAAYEPPTISGEDLVEKIWRVADGEYLISSASLYQAPAKPSLHLQKEALVALCEQEEVPVPELKQEEQSSHAPLEQDPLGMTDRQIIILQLILLGCTNKQIARALDVSEQRMKNCLTSILKRFQVRNRTAAVVAALRRGLISFDDARPYDLSLDQGAFARRTQYFVGPRVVPQQEGLLPMAANA
jgi:DNA-binding NarL/FixJ family response regulator